MATENITQLTPQTGSADPTSLLYAVTGVGTYSDTGLPLSVFVNNLGLTGVPTAPTATTGTNTTQIASTAFVQAQLISSLAPYALKSVDLSQFASTTSAQLAGIISDETGSGSLVFGTSPTFAGTVVIPTVTLSGGTINSTSIGATTASTGKFTTLQATSGLNSTAVGNTTASTGAFTTLSASSTVSGTGFSTYLASPPAIGGTAANAGSFTTLNASGLISPTSSVGIKGTTTNDSPSAGSIGEFVTASVTTSTAWPNATNVAGQLTSILLTAGNWMVGGSVFWDAGTRTGAWTGLETGFNAGSAVLPLNQFMALSAITPATVVNSANAIPTQFFKLTSTTTVYMMGLAQYSSGNMNYLCNMWAIRVR